MTHPPPGDGAQPPERLPERPPEHPARRLERSWSDLSAEAEAQVLRAGQRLAQLIERLESGEVAAAGEVPGAITQLDKALGAVFHERARRERQAGGDAPAPGTLDLDAARAEVGRRLARLRALGGAAALSDGAD